MGVQAVPLSKMACLPTPSTFLSMPYGVAPAALPLLVPRQRARPVMAGADEDYLSDLERQLEDVQLGVRRPTERPAGTILPRSSKVVQSGRAWYDRLYSGQPILLLSLALLFGFWSFVNTMEFQGAAGFWEPISALIPTLVTERISREYYSRRRSERSPTLKVGWCLGAFPHAEHSPLPMRALCVHATTRDS